MKEENDETLMGNCLNKSDRFLLNLLIYVLFNKALTNA
jgi:hypothetical protein